MAQPPSHRSRLQRGTSAPGPGGMPDVEPVPLPTRLAGGALVAAALSSLARPWLLGLWAPQLAPAAQSYGSVGLQILLGVALLQGSEGARRFVLWTAGIGMLVVLGAFPLLHQGGVLWAMLLATLVPLAALVALLAGRPARVRTAFSLAMVVVGLLGGLALEVWIVRRPIAQMRREISEWASTEREFRDDRLGVQLALPGTWVRLREGNPVIEAKDGILATFAHRDATAAAFIFSAEVHEGLRSPDHALDKMVRGLRESWPDLAEVERGDTRVGAVPARSLRVTWTHESVRHVGRLLAWQDAWRYFVFGVHVTEFTEERLRPDVDALLANFVIAPRLATAVNSAVSETVAVAPHLTRAAVEAVARRYPGRQLTPEWLFRACYQFANRGVALLDAAEKEELRVLNRALFAEIPPRERGQLGAYLELLKFDRPTTAEEDRRLQPVMKAGFDRLPEASRLRLQQLFEAAIDRAAIL